MGTTAIRQIPYPEATDPADVPTDMREMAERLDNLYLVSGQTAQNWMIMGGSNVVTTSAGVATITFLFPVVAVTSVVVCNGDTTVLCVVGVNGVPTTTGFTIRAQDYAGANFNGTVRVNWQALVRP